MPSQSKLVIGSHHHRGARRDQRIAPPYTTSLTPPYTTLSITLHHPTFPYNTLQQHPTPPYIPIQGARHAQRGGPRVCGLARPARAALRGVDRRGPPTRPQVLV